MRAFIRLATLALICSIAEFKTSPPKVQVYSHTPGKFGKPNILVCNVSGFHPPDIKIEILKNGKEIPESNQTDLAFTHGWQFHLTKSVAFTPLDDEKYACRVTHGKNTADYAWQSDM